MKHRRVYAYDTGGRTVLLRGAADVLRANGMPARWSPIRRGHELHRDRLPDFLAAAQESGRAVVIKDGKPTT